VTNDQLAIRCRGLRVVRAGRTVLPGLDLDVPAGQLVGLLGPSGCGKSTLMRSVVGAQRVAGGEVTVLGLPAGHRDLRARLGYLTQSVSVYDDLTVTENLRDFATVVGAPRSDVARVLADVAVAARGDSRVGELSGGQRSRVALAVALLGRPELLVLDEPTVGLDPVLRRDLWQLFRSLAAGGATLLVSSHVMDEATRCDRMVMLYDGRVLADGTLPQLLDRTGAPDADGAFLALVEAAA
jgi:ABC-2 type transport system ATP-binding protein